MNAVYVLIILFVCVVLGVALFVSLKKKKQIKQHQDQQPEKEEIEEPDTVKVVNSSISQEDYFKERQSYLFCYINLLNGLKSESCVNYLKYQLSNDRFVSKVDSYIQSENKLISSSQRRHLKTIDDLVSIINETLKNIETLKLKEVTSVDMFHLPNISTSLNFIRGQYIDLIDIVSRVPEISDFVVKFESDNKIYKPTKQQEQQPEPQQPEEVIDYKAKYEALLIESERVSLDLEQSKQRVQEQEGVALSLGEEIKKKDSDILTLEGLQKTKSKQINMLTRQLDEVKRKIETLKNSDIKTELSSIVDPSKYIDLDRYNSLEDSHKKTKNRNRVITITLSFIAVIAITAISVVVLQNKATDIIYNNKIKVESNLESVTMQRDSLIEIIKRDVFIQLEKYDFENEESIKKVLDSKNLEFNDVVGVVNEIRAENKTKTSTLDKLKKTREDLIKDISTLEKEIKDKEDKAKLLREQSSQKQGEIDDLEKQIQEKQKIIDQKTQQLESITPRTSEASTQITPAT